EIGRRPLRRLLRRRSALNVLGELTPTDAPTHTLIVHAHHDAAHTGLVFHPAIAKLAARFGGRVIERIGGTPAPMWGAAAGPILVALGAGLGRRRISRLGAALSAAYAAAMWDIAHRPVVPGANDNLSGVAALLMVADALSRSRCGHVRVLLLSTGSEESFLEGMEAFAARHFDGLPEDSTTFLCLESVGSPELMLLSGEGLLRLHRYPGEPRRTLERLADRQGIALHKPFRYRLATDGQLPLRAGYPTAVISSIDFYKAPSNYHWPSDRPENLCLETLTHAAGLAVAFAEELDRAAAPR
ncbi:MAG TPA: M28 family peptidase, partial [Solirubrobacteraceae bacterium]|nr:M28 family peptidase [Solirubrobacteraceae bacterium]